MQINLSPSECDAVVKLMKLAIVTQIGKSPAKRDPDWKAISKQFTLAEIDSIITEFENA